MPNINLGLNLGDFPETLAGVRTQFRDLSQTVQTLTRDSQDYVAVVARLGQLRGEIRNFRDDLNHLNPEQQFQRFQGVLNGLVGGFAAATGVVALFGAQNEELEKTLIKVNAAIALLGGFQALTDGVRDLKLLLALTNPELAVLLVALGAVAGAAIYLAHSTNTLTEAQKANYEFQLKSIDGYIKEKISVQSLLAEAQRENTTKQRKKEIIQELNTLSPLYFHSIKTEQDLQEKATEAVEKYIKAIEIKAEVQAAQDKLAEVQKPIIERQIKLQTELADQTNKTYDTEERKQKTIQAYKDRILNGTDEELIALKKKAEPILTVIGDLQKKLDQVGGDPTGQRNTNFVKAVKDWQAYLDELERRAEVTDEKIKFSHAQTTDAASLINAAKARADALAKATGTDTIDPAKIKNPFTGLNLEQTLNVINTQYGKQQLAIEQQRAKGLITDSQYNAQLLDSKNIFYQNQIDALTMFGENSVEIQSEQAQAEIEIDKMKTAAKREELQNIANLLDEASQLAGQQTAAGKALAIASTTISTYLAAQQAYASQFLPVPDVSSPIRGTIAAAVAIAGGLLRVKQILSVKIPGTSGGGGSSAGTAASIPTYSAPKVPAATNTTNLSGNSLAQINQQQNSPMRAYVVESDITTSQQRVNGYQSQGSF